MEEIIPFLDAWLEGQTNQKESKKKIFEELQSTNAILSWMIEVLHH
jgi:hypothetical protein